VTERRPQRVDSDAWTGEDEPSREPSRLERWLDRRPLWQWLLVWVAISALAAPNLLKHPMAAIAIGGLHVAAALVWISAVTFLTVVPMVLVQLSGRKAGLVAQCTTAIVAAVVVTLVFRLMRGVI